MSGVQLGVSLPTSGPQASPELMLRVAQDAERAGLGSVWTNERLLRPTRPIAMGGPGGPVMDPPEGFACVYDPLEVLSYAAARTDRVALGTSVLDGLFHAPVVLARRLATLDRLSGGRLLAGVGQGWMAEEFEAAGVPMSRRGAGFEEHLRAMRAVWGPDPVRFDGRFHHVPECEIGPKPVRPGGPTLLLGAGAPASLGRAARLGAGLTLVVFDWVSLTGMIETYRAAAREAGTDAGPVVVQVNGAVTAAPLDERTPLTGSAEQVAEDLPRLDALGVAHVFWAMPEEPTEAVAAVAPLLAR
ncbi:TIGR03619 family F420-dependent LLM class oxidoreductase [Isoptericola cucumis]|uniref:LLM class F420-dependent oxidoreductase n=1 Tax=Isoptericola cucumis TaxID=1776856 RepID=A0ABQ2B4N7_9MICO|nr:TIGR03619 family F420-dependent LLM class oxidoreductase [Isoptericola cucumis]GGI07867.1 LLM class F420-dependent oxidoreductase [Isoptericola cucumis]